MQKRIDAMRTKVREERERLSEMSDNLSADLKRVLKPASFRLDDVENFFVDRKILAEPRPAAQLARWLGHAETALRQAIQHRKYVEDLVKKFGPNARMVG